MTTKQRKRIRKSSAKRVAVKEAANTLVADLPLYAPPLFEPHRYKVLYGGRGGARSWTVARTLLIRAAQQKTRILCTREFQTSIKDSVHQLLKDQIELLGLQGFTVVHNEIRHTNGSLFLFEGLRHNITKIKSLEGIDICWVEEAERITKESWRVLIPTIRKAGSEIWVTFNPDQEDDATYQRFIVNPPKNAWVKHVTFDENPWFPPELREEMEYDYANDPESAAHVWEGATRTVTEAQILRGKYVVREFTPFLGHTKEEPCAEMLKSKSGSCPHAWGGPYQGMDFGFANDPNAAVRLWVHERVLYVEYEWYQVHCDIDHIADPDQIKSVHHAIPNFADYVTRADSARPDSISYLRRHGLPRIVGVKKGPGSVEEGVRHLRSYSQIVIHPRCVHVKNEAKLYSYKVDERTEDVLPIIVDKHNHTMDSSRYALEPMIKSKPKVGVLFVGAPRMAQHQLVAKQQAEEDEADRLALAGHTNGNGNGNGNGHKPLVIERFRGLNRR